MENSGNPPTLAYLPKRSRRPSTKVVIWLVVAVLVASVAYLERSRLRVFGETLRHTYDRRECLSYIAPANQIVYEEEPTAAALLLKRPGYIGAAQQPGQSGWAVAARGTGCPVFFVPDCVSRFLECPPDQLDSNDPGPATIVYSHRARMPSGQERLLLVRLRSYPRAGGDSGFWISAEFYDVDSWKRHAVPIGGSVGYADGTIASGLGIDQSTHPPVTVYAGQPEQNDPGKFTIVFRLGGQRHTIEGECIGDYSVNFTVRD